MPNKAKRKGNCFICGKHNVPLCNRCGCVHACKIHWLSHHQNDYCFPFLVKLDQDQSHCIVAARDIQPLELIYFERPLAFGPPLYRYVRRLEFPKKINIFIFFSNETICAECGKSIDANSKCGLCDMPVCNDVCQIGYNHYTECQVLQNVRNSVPDLNLKLKSILPIRLLSAKKTSESAFKKAQLFHQGKEIANEILT